MVPPSHRIPQLSLLPICDFPRAWSWGADWNKLVGTAFCRRVEQRHQRSVARNLSVPQIPASASPLGVEPVRSVPSRPMQCPLSSFGPVYGREEEEGLCRYRIFCEFWESMKGHGTRQSGFINSLPLDEQLKMQLLFCNLRSNIDKFSSKVGWDVFWYWS